MTDDDLKGLLNGLQQQSSAAHTETRRHFDQATTEVQRHFDQAATEMRRHFDVTAERLEGKIEAIAEMVANVEEKLDRRIDDVEQRDGPRFRGHAGDDLILTRRARSPHQQTGTGVYRPAESRRAPGNDDALTNHCRLLSLTPIPLNFFPLP